MPTTHLTLRQRRRRTEKLAKNPLGKLGFTLALALSLFVTIIGVLLTLAYVAVTRNLPPVQLLTHLLSPSNGAALSPTRVLDRSGSVDLLALQNPAAKTQRYLFYKELPQVVFLSTLAANDPDFWNHPGFTVTGLLQPGRSTLARQLVDTHLLAGEPPGFLRTLRSYLLSAQLTSTFGREQILEWFLNQANFGRLTYGIDAAALVYFGKPAGELNLAEAAMLAAIPNAPALNPHDTPRLAVDRQREVIERLQVLGWISADQATNAFSHRLEIQPVTDSPPQIAPDFTRKTLETLADTIGWERIERGHLTIHTTLDAGLQEQVNCALSVHLARLTGRPGAAAPPGCEAARLIPTLNLNEQLSAQDLAAAVLVYDPHTGAILALASAGPPFLADALDDGRPAGTLLTPFVYLSGFTRGLTPASLTWDTPNGTSDPPDAPLFDEAYQGPMRLRNALANDDLPPAVQIFDLVGNDTVWRTTRQIGLANLELATEGAGLPTLWQGGRATLIEVARAYGTLANQGVLVGSNKSMPLYFSQVLEAGGEPLPGFAALSRPVVSAELAYLVNDILSDEAARWRSLGHPNSLEIGRLAAAKLGRTSNGQDGWAVGYTPDLLVAVWLGAPETDNVPVDLAEAAAALWHGVIQAAVKTRPVNDWPQPAGITRMDVCDPSGLLPTADCPNLVNEVFAIGTEPTHPDTLYRRLEINRNTGKLATILTPAELVEERVYLIVPPEAAAWAEKAGLPVPPQDYDLIVQSPPANSGVTITAPSPFAVVRGNVEILGSVAGAGLDFYRLQIGQGLNPSQWLQIGTDQEQAARNSSLALWDTTGLNGLYTIQLIRVNRDRQINSANVQVTVDNRPPLGELVYPPVDASLAIPLDGNLLFRVDASDELGIDRIEFLIDGKSAGVATRAPYYLSWSARPGAHTLSVRIHDRAGNMTELESGFSIQP